MTDRDGRGAARWAEPEIEWHLGPDDAAQLAWLTAHGVRLVTWPPAPFEATATESFKVGDEYWIWQSGVGGIAFKESEHRLRAILSPGSDRRWFDRVIRRSWLPAVYQVWGRQVLHATAVADTETGDVLAFAGPSGAGKSTIAYGLGRRAGWSLVCDDTLAFSPEGGAVTLHPMPNEPRLRPPSAAYYGTTGRAVELKGWPARPIRLRAVYFLDGDPHLERPVRIERLDAAGSYSRLLDQAHTLTLAIPRHNQQLMRTYADLAARVPVFSLQFRKSFDAIEAVLDAVEAHRGSADDGGRPSEPAGALV
jgi:hypothetical protein